MYVPGGGGRFTGRTERKWANLHVFWVVPDAVNHACWWHLLQTDLVDGGEEREPVRNTTKTQG